MNKEIILLILQVIGMILNNNKNKVTKPKVLNLWL